MVRTWKALVGQACVSDVKVTSYVPRLRSTFVSPKGPEVLPLNIATLSMKKNLSVSGIFIFLWSQLSISSFQFIDI